MIYFSIKPEHAVLSTEGAKVMLEAVGDARILLNGEEVMAKEELHHNDRYVT